MQYETGFPSAHCEATPSSNTEPTPTLRHPSKPSSDLHPSAHTVLQLTPSTKEHKRPIPLSLISHTDESEDPRTRAEQLEPEPRTRKKSQSRKDDVPPETIPPSKNTPHSRGKSKGVSRKDGVPLETKNSLSVIPRSGTNTLPRKGTLPPNQQPKEWTQTLPKNGTWYPVESKGRPRALSWLAPPASRLEELIQLEHSQSTGVLEWDDKGIPSVDLGTQTDVRLGRATSGTISTQTELSSNRDGISSQTHPMINRPLSVELSNRPVELRQDLGSIADIDKRLEDVTRLLKRVEKSVATENKQLNTRLSLLELREDPPPPPTPLPLTDGGVTYGDPPPSPTPLPLTDGGVTYGDIPPRREATRPLLPQSKPETRVLHVSQVRQKDETQKQFIGRREAEARRRSALNSIEVLNLLEEYREQEYQVDHFNLLSDQPQYKAKREHITWHDVEQGDQSQGFVLGGEVAGVYRDLKDMFNPSPSTLTTAWATFSITLMNFGYFTGGYYAFRYFHSLHEEEWSNKTMLLLQEKALLLEKYPVLGSSNLTLNTYTQVSEMLCTISKHPQSKWGFWASFDFCVSVITTVGYGVLSPQTFIGRLFCLVYAACGLPLYIIMLGASGKYICTMFEKLDFCKCKNIFLELAVKYFNIAIVLGGFLMVFSYFGMQASKPSLPPEDQTTIIEMITVNNSVVDFSGTLNFSKIGVTEWGYLDVFYYSMISLTTIGFGDYFLTQGDDPRQVWKQAAMLFVSVTFGFALFSYAFETYAAASERQIKFFKEQAEKMSAIAAKKSLEMSQRVAQQGMEMSQRAAVTSWQAVAKQAKSEREPRPELRTAKKWQSLAERATKSSNDDANKISVVPKDGEVDK